VDLQTQRTAATQVASGPRSFVAGLNNTASGFQSVAMGSTCTASGSQAFAMGSTSLASNTGSTAMGNSTASGTQSFAMGNSTASGTQSVAIGAGSATSTSSIALGASNASSSYSAAIGFSTTTGAYSFACGYALGAQVGKFAFSGGPLGAQGDVQTGMMVLARETTTNTTVVLTSNNSAAGATNQLIVSTDKVIAFTGELIGKQSGSANIAAYTITGTLVNNAGTVTMPTGTLTAIGTDTIGLDTAPALAADNTNKGLTVTSGAKTTTTIRWVCTLRSTENVKA
jgi:hypothetical protein